MKTLAAILLFSGCVAQAATLNVTNYGVLGDYREVWVSTTTNSATIVTTNEMTSADIGKTLQLFGAGYYARLHNGGLGGTTPTNHFNGNYQSTPTNHMDMVATIVSVSNGTNIGLDVACGVTASNLRMGYGTNNTLAVSNVIHIAASNDVIYFPGSNGVYAGNYLIMHTNSIRTNFVQSGIYNSYAAINLTKAGLTFLGDGTNLTTITGSGAWRQQGIDAAYRGSLFKIAGAPTNNGPLIFSNIKFDGASTRNRGTYTTFPAIPTDGGGWDPTHHFFTDGIPVTDVPYIGFTNLYVTRWHGETIQGVSSGNGRVDIGNCVFLDGNSTVINLNNEHYFHDNLVKDYYQVAEDGQFTLATGRAWIYNNRFEDIFGSPAFAITGAYTNIAHPGFVLSNNVAIIASPKLFLGVAGAKNVTVISNWPGGAITIGMAGQQGTDYKRNWIIAGNHWTNGLYAIGFGGSGNNRAVDVEIYDNDAPGMTSFFAYHQTGAGAWSTNVTFLRNTSNKSVDGSSAAGQWFLVDDSNNFPWRSSTDAVGVTNTLSYAYGSRHVITSKHANSRYVLDNASPLKIPNGAVKIVTNATASTATFNSPALELAGATAQTFYRVSGAWTTNSSWSAGFVTELIFGAP